METDQLISYINVERQKGIRPQTISDALQTAGWQKEAIARAFVRVFGMKPSINILKLPSVGNLMSETVNLYQSKGKVLLSVSFLINFIIALTGYLTLSMSKSDGLQVPIAVVLIFSLVGIVARLWLTPSLTYAVVNLDAGVTAGQALRPGNVKVFGYWWMELLTSIVLMLGLILLVIPFFIFATWYVFAPYVFYAEHLRGIKALQKSKALSGGYVPSLMWKFFVLGLLTLFVMIVLEILMKLINIPELNIGLSFVVTSLITPFPLIYTGLLYRRLVQIKSYAPLT